uniref:SCAN box domain-containing protein n=1 Tax=Xenopus tropicalis TaxID=8364 RepID=A0A803JEZ4_XENTR
ALKEEILVHLGVTLAVHAKRFNDWVYTRGKSARAQMHDLLYLTRNWLQPDLNTADQVVERIVVERYRKALPQDLQRWVGQADPQDMTQMVELVERFVATEGYLGEGVSPQRPGKAQRLQENPGKTVPFLKGVVSQSKTETPVWPLDLIQAPSLEWCPVSEIFHCFGSCGVEGVTLEMGPQGRQRSLTCPQNPLHPVIVLERLG